MTRSSLLEIGRTADAKMERFTLPEDALVQTFADMGIRGSGKSTLAAVMCEEFCRLGLPWIMLDPVDVGWGLRAGKDGKPTGGLPIVVFGGQHGDLPLAKDQGARIAETLIELNVCAVISLKMESKTTWRKFTTDFCLRLLELNPSVPRHIFLEEAAEFVPQKTKVAVTAACKEAVERLVRLGRNSGYGCTLINQRPATVDKDVLSQCENLFMLRTVGKHDRKASMEWLEPKFAEQYPEDERRAKSEALKLVNSLASLPDGRAYFWSPSWLKMFALVQVRDRTTFHPGATRRDMRGGAKSVELMDAREFIEKVRTKLTRVVASSSAIPKATLKGPVGRYLSEAPSAGVAAIIGSADAASRDVEEVSRLRRDLEAERVRVNNLEGEVAKARAGAVDAQRRLDAVKKMLEPQYLAMKALFEELGSAGASGNGGMVDKAWVEPWLEKATRTGCRRLLEIMMDKGRLTQQQLATLAGVTPRTFRNYRAWLTRNNLVRLEGEWPQGTMELGQ